MAKFSYADWGNRLYNGEKSYRIVQTSTRWFIITGVFLVASVVLLLVRGINPGIDFTGGTQFMIPEVSEVSADPGIEVVAELAPDQEPRVTILGGSDVRIQMGAIDPDLQIEMGTALAEAYDVSVDEIGFDQIGPTWGAEVGSKALQGLVIFVILVFIVIAFYFRNWRMAVAAMVALMSDLAFTVGVYALLGFEVTPATVIGFLTILGYSLYDTVVVFDKVRENTEDLTAQRRYTYAELSNLAINQTIVRSINTSVVALLPVASILFVGSLLLGAGTLNDIALALFVGIAVGTYSSIFVAAPLEVVLRRNDERVAEHTSKVLELRESGEADVVLAEDGSVRVGALQPGAHLGTSAQPRRKRR